MKAETQLVRADSWDFGPGAANTQLLKTISNAQEATFLGGGCAPGPPAAQGPNMPKTAAVPTGKPPLAPAQQASHSTNSVLTAGPGSKEAAAEGSCPTQLLLPMRQISLDGITAADLCRPAEPLPDRSSIFNDVIEQLAAKEESLPAQAGLYTLPSIQFLESLLEDMDSKSASTGHQPADPPLYLPLDAFDLPFDESQQHKVATLGTVAGGNTELAPSPFALPSQAQQPPHGHYGYPPQHPFQQQQSQRLPPHPQSQPVYHVHVHAGVQHPLPGHGHGFIPTSSSMPILSNGHSGYHGSSQVPHCRSAGPSPTKPVRRASSSYSAYEYQLDEELQTSKSGRMRKANSFAGAKRKMSGECLPRGPALPPDSGAYHYQQHPHHQLHPAGQYHQGAMPGHHLGNSSAASESDTEGATTLDDESDEEVSKGSKASRKQAAAVKKGGKRTTCLNCGCHQTPQWRCGPLGPRTLCNACGVRYKKGLPLNCWPIREGMVLPPGAVLPPGVHIPGVILQPAEDE